MNDDHSLPLTLAQKLNLETGKLSWWELQTYFARGIVIVLSAQEDLVKTAVQLHEDNKTQIEGMIERGVLQRANDAHAIDWVEREPDFWAVVVTPWVLVQEVPTNLN